MTANPTLIAALEPLVRRVRTDVTVVKKPTGQAWTQEPLTEERLARHLNGGPARGVSPMQPGASVTLVAVLDFDAHRGEVPWGEMAATAAKVHDALTLAWGCNPLAFRSSGGAGVHLILIWDEPQEARIVRRWLAHVLQHCDLAPGTGGVRAGEVEVFPRQDRVRPGGYGNQFILPLAGKSEWLAYDDLADTLGPADAPLTAEAWSASPSVPLDGPWKSEGPREGGPATSTQKVTPCSADYGVPTEQWQALVHDPLMAIGNGMGAKGALGDGPGLDYDAWLRVCYAVHWATGGDPQGLEWVEAWSSRSAKYVPGYLQAKVWDPATGQARRRESGDAVTTAETLWVEARRHGWVDPRVVGAFPMLSRGNSPGPQVQEQLAPAGGAGDAGAPAAPPERRGVPLAKHLSTDQANANRLVSAFGERVLVAGGRWHTWDSRRWAIGEADVYRYTCRLSEIVREEAKRWRRRAEEAAEAAAETAAEAEDGAAEAGDKPAAVAIALEKWSKRCEMKGTIEAAIGLACKMLTVEADLMDADPWALNCLNGIVDLRTGRLKPHDPGALITRLAQAEYPGAEPAPAVAEGLALWQRTVLDICAGSAELARFLQRWFGYCTTGQTREQVLAIHWGDGSNGKSTLLDTIARVLGDYAGTASAGLLAGGSDTGPGSATPEIAALRGRRMVTAHESRDGVALREDFVKRATGGDRMVARHLYGDPFEFTPTHKLQLLTNSKPSVRGQDHGIWRRVRLVPYAARFGGEDEVSTGRATQLREFDLAERLDSDAVRSAVLLWLVRGAVEWARDGLQAPAAVLEASESYRHEQDRVRQFLHECCELDLTGAQGWAEPLTDGMLGLYPTYQSWCRDSGTHALSRQRFVGEVQRVHPLATTREASVRDGGRRRTVLRVANLRLLT